MLRTSRALLSAFIVATGSSYASAQATFEWTDTTTNWGTASAWNLVSGTGSPPPNSNLHTANFNNQATILNQPDIGAINYDLQRLSMNNTGADWNLNGTGTIRLFSSSNVNTSAAIQINGANTPGSYTVLTPNLELGASNFWYATTGAALEVAGNISSSNTTNVLNLRPDVGATIRLSGNNTISVGTGNSATVGAAAAGTGTARLEINTDQPFGTGNLSFGGTGLSFTLSAIGTSRTITNNATYAVNWNVDGSNDVIFSGTVNNANSSARTITSNTTGGAALIFNGNSALSAGTAQTTTWQDTGRIEHNGVLSDGGSGAVTLVLNGTSSTFTTRLTGVNTYTGNTQLIQGTLILGGDAPNAAPGTLGNSNLTVAVGNLGSGTNTAI
ncbi:MAG TPA: hypothetical protein PKD72_06630, partial [Gemmatales bacterium]|nr:hypothetical protein [Gemmatales bacterium]